MHVADEDAFEFLETSLFSSKRQLNALSRINQVRVTVNVQKLRSGAPRWHRHRCTRPEKHHFESHPIRSGITLTGAEAPKTFG